MMPWEAGPARFALTQPPATALASSSEAPSALSSAALIRVKRSAWMMGMGFPLSAPACEAGLVVTSLVVAVLMVAKSWSQSDGRRASGKNEWPGAAKSGLRRGFHTTELTNWGEPPAGCLL